MKTFRFGKIRDCVCGDLVWECELRIALWGAICEDGELPLALSIILSVITAPITFKSIILSGLSLRARGDFLRSFREKLGKTRTFCTELRSDAEWMHSSFWL